MIVVDTSVAVKWVVPEGAPAESGTRNALLLLQDDLIAPDCLLAEFANALFKKVQRGQASGPQTIEATAILPELVDLLPSVPLMPAALRLALALPHPVHDCLFLAAAQLYGVTLVTADAKFVAACAGSGRHLPVELL